MNTIALVRRLLGALLLSVAVAASAAACTGGGDHAAPAHIVDDPRWKALAAE